MTRTLFFLLFLAVFSLASLWFVENDGSVVVEWMGYRAQTSVMFAILFVIITIITFTLLLQLIIWVRTAPKRYKKAMKDKRQSRGLTALSQGFAAIAAGDIKQARVLTQKASNNLDNMPLTKLLAAQTAQLEGNRELAKVHYNSMLGDKETEIIAIKGLLIEAKQENDLGKSLFLAEKALALRPDADWAILILFDLYRKMHHWQKAAEITHTALKYNLITKEDSARNLGLIYLMQYLEQSKNLKHVKNEKLIENAYKLIPDFVPAIIAYANMLFRKEKTRKALKILESGWSKSPHPDIATTYMENYANSTNEKRLEKAEKLFNLSSGHPEGNIVIARELITSGKFSDARRHLKIALQFGETSVICYLLAELESLEKADPKVVHHWREHALVANNVAIWECKSCNIKSPKWNVTCSNCGAFDSFTWKDSQNILRNGNLTRT